MKANRPDKLIIFMYMVTYSTRLTGATSALLFHRHVLHQNRCFLISFAQAHKRRRNYKQWLRFPYDINEFLLYGPPLHYGPWRDRDVEVFVSAAEVLSIWLYKSHSRKDRRHRQGFFICLKFSISVSKGPCQWCLLLDSENAWSIKYSNTMRFIASYIRIRDVIIYVSNWQLGIDRFCRIQWHREKKRWMTRSSYHDAIRNTWRRKTWARPR